MLNVAFLLDESGSMGSTQDEVISGYNKYIASVKDVKFTLTMFNGAGVTVVHDAVSIKKVPKLTEKTYSPGYTTPLLDAIGTTIKSIGKKKKVLFVIFTDGYENSSREYTKEIVEKLIKKRTKRGWQFMFLGADLSGIQSAAEMGIPLASTHHYEAGTEVEELTSAGVYTTNWVESGGTKTIKLDLSE